MRLASAFLTVGVWTLLSRILGFARDIMIAAYLGAGPVAEAFLIAFSLPNMFRRFFAEGAFNMAFIPMFSKKLEADEDAHGFAQNAFAGLAFVLILFSFIALFAMPWLVTLMASGFRGDERFDLAVLFGRIAFPYILFISLAALLSGVLNATRRFVAAAAAPVLLNVLFVGSLIIADALSWDLGLTLAWTVPVAGIAQLALVWEAARRAGFTLRIRRPVLSPDIKRLAVIAAPAALAGGVVQVNLLVGRQVASFFDGAIVWLGLADRLYQLPLGVVGIAMGVVLLPDLSHRLRAGDTDGGRHAFNRASEMALTLTIPAAVALIAIPVPLVAVLFERGAFTADDTAQTALAVAIYGAGLPAFVLQKTLQPLYFAREDTRTPFRIAVWAMVINLVIAVGAAPIFGFIAAAVATTLAGWVTVALLWIRARPMGDAASLDRRFLHRLPRIVLAAIAMGVIIRLAADWAESTLPDVLYTPFGLALLVTLGFGCFGALALASGAVARTDLAMLRRR
jgi:putative peptidoglycan lipid II flippase